MHYTVRACIWRGGRKLLSYQVISAENCPCLTGARGFAAFYLVQNNKGTHGGVYVGDRESPISVDVEKQAVEIPCTRIAKTVQKFRRTK